MCEEGRKARLEGTEEVAIYILQYSGSCGPVTVTDRSADGLTGLEK